ncbi:MAG: hypothetical protein SGI73_19825 [Chloroflexota bacterium]|nr:hypothetical protein [Chloroflexota bacterium]
MIVWAIILLSAAPTMAQDNGFGVIEGFWLPDETCTLGVSWERIIFDWAQHQPTGADDWYTLNVDDRWLKAANACGREIVAVVKHTPAWATDGLEGAGVPRGLDLPVDDPGNLWANFMRRAAAYYASRGVRRFIIWNEPDITRETYGYEFEGTLDEYFQLLKVASIAAKQGNPSALIHVAGTTYWHDVNAGRRLYIDRLLERITADPDAPAHDYYFDALTVHVYFRVETVYDIARAMRALLEQYDLGYKHIWIVETNASPNLDPAWRVERPVWQIDLTQQASYLVQAAALGLAAGADHVGVYKLYDWNLPIGAESFGIVRADGSRRPAFDAWRTVARHFVGVESAGVAANDAAVIVRLMRTDGTQILVAWARTADGAQVRIPTDGQKAVLSDELGGMIRLHPLDSDYTVILPGATCNAADGCPVGGRTAILIQPRQVVEMIAGAPSPYVRLTSGGTAPLMWVGDILNGI